MENTLVNNKIGEVMENELNHNHIIYDFRFFGLALKV